MSWDEILWSLKEGYWLFHNVYPEGGKSFQNIGTCIPTYMVLMGLSTIAFIFTKSLIPPLSSTHSSLNDGSDFLPATIKYNCEVTNTV
jgi:hypothetical protein